jgi:uncharacterized membrane protein YgdD (TMEM256/DUF423 family)
MERIFVLIGAVLGGLGVGLGAFGAHALKTRVAPELLRVWDVGTHYQMIHALALLGVAWLVSRWPESAAATAGWLFVAGTVLFSGSLYALALTGVKKLGMITPVGGLALVAGWFVLAWTAWRAGE